jgi:hypothetical protein
MKNSHLLTIFLIDYINLLGFGLILPLQPITLPSHAERVAAGV